MRMHFGLTYVGDGTVASEFHAHEITIEFTARDVLAVSIATAWDALPLAADRGLSR